MTLAARLAKDGSASDDRMTMFCSRRLSSVIAAPAASTSKWLRATGTRPSAQTSQVMMATCAAGLTGRATDGGGSMVAAV